MVSPVNSTLVAGPVTESGVNELMVMGSESKNENTNRPVGLPPVDLPRTPCPMHNRVVIVYGPEPAILVSVN